MCGYYFYFEWNIQGFKFLGGVLYGFLVGMGIYDDVDKWCDWVGGYWLLFVLKMYFSYFLCKMKNYGL